MFQHINKIRSITSSVFPRVQSFSSTSRSVDLRSDTVTQPSPEMRERMGAAVVGDDVYGEDPTVRVLQEKVARLCGKDAALFVPSGTQSNLIAVGAHCQRGSEVILGSKSHIFCYEGAGASAYMGVGFSGLANEKDGTLNLNDVKQAIRPVNDHFPNTSLICVENTHNNCGGTIISPQYLKLLKSVAIDYNGVQIPIHMDGARLWNASIALNCSLKDLLLDVDSVSICLSKGLGAPVGSLLVGSKDFIVKAKRLRKSLGGGMRQTGILAAAGLYALENNYDRINDDHRRAKLLAAGLSKIPGISLQHDVTTNIMYLSVANNLGNDLVSILKNEFNILIGSYSTEKVRAVTHLDISDEDIDNVLYAVMKVMHHLLHFKDFKYYI
jgi:threonine aldolase